MFAFCAVPFGKVVAIGQQDPASDTAKRLFRQFVVLYNTAVQEEEDGKAVVVFSDESYVNTGHHAQYGWFAPEWLLRAPTGKGARLIILHALTKDGLLTTNGADGKPLDVKFDDPSDQILTAELIFQAGAAEPTKKRKKKNKKQKKKKRKKQNSPAQAIITTTWTLKATSSGYARASSLLFESCTSSTTRGAAR